MGNGVEHFNVIISHFYFIIEDDAYFISPFIGWMFLFFSYCLNPLCVLGINTLSDA